MVVCQLELATSATREAEAGIGLRHERVPAVEGKQGSNSCDDTAVGAL